MQESLYTRFISFIDGEAEDETAVDLHAETFPDNRFRIKNIFLGTTFPRKMFSEERWLATGQFFNL